MKFDAYTDPGHSWVKVPRSLLVKLGISTQITPFSYERADMVYLEEDCDFSTFYNAMVAKGKTVDLRIHHANKSSKIRSYMMYSPHKQSSLA
jgi:hypothetical protein